MLLRGGVWIGRSFSLATWRRRERPRGARGTQQMSAAAQAELIHDVQLDYFGKQLATAGGDRRIKIYEVVNGEKSHQTAELVGHDGPVWRVAWAHPQFGNVLASCSYDRQVFVWREHSPQQWSLVHKFLGHEGSVNCISFGPRCAHATNPARMHRSINAAIQPTHGRTRAERHAGPPVATGTWGRPPPASMVRAQILSLPAVSCGVLEQGVWAAARVRVLRREYCGAHVPWRALTWPGTGALPFTLPFTLPSPPRTHTMSFTRSPRPSTSSRGSLPPPHRCGRCGPCGQWTSTMIKAHKIGVNAVSWAPACSGMRLVTGGCDNLVKIWNCDESSTWVEVSTLGRADERHTDWVRDVAWAPTVDGAAEMIASCSQDKKVIIWTAGRAGEWVSKSIQMSWCATRRSNRRAHRSLHVCVCACAPPPPPSPSSSRPTRRQSHA